MSLFVLYISDNVGRNFASWAHTVIQKVFIRNVSWRFYAKSKFCVCFKLGTYTCKICLPMIVKLCALNHLQTQLISLSFCSDVDQKRVFIVNFFPFSDDCSVLRSHFGANVILDITFISNYVIANTYLAGLEVN